jgi:hypothetical protein
VKKEFYAKPEIQAEILGPVALCQYSGSIYEESGDGDCGPLGASFGGGGGGGGGFGGFGDFGGGTGYGGSGGFGGSGPG